MCDSVKSALNPRRFQNRTIIQFIGKHLEALLFEHVGTQNKEGDSNMLNMRAIHTYRLRFGQKGALAADEESRVIITQPKKGFPYIASGGKRRKITGLDEAEVLAAIRHVVPHVGTHSYECITAAGSRETRLFSDLEEC